MNGKFHKSWAKLILEIIHFSDFEVVRPSDRQKTSKLCAYCIEALEWGCTVCEIASISTQRCMAMVRDTNKYRTGRRVKAF